MTRDRGFYSAYFRQMLAIALGALITHGVSMIDSIMLGAYSQQALSGVALCNQYQFFLHQVILLGTAEGLAVLCSQYFGRRDKKSVFQVASIGVVTSLGVALFLFVLATAAPTACLSVFTDEQPYIQEGLNYFSVIRFSYPLFALTYTLLALLRSMQISHLAIWCSLGALGTNVALNYILIFGNFGALRLGTKGAAIATLASRAVELGIVVVYIWRKRSQIGEGEKIRFSLRAGLVKDYLKATVPLMMSSGLWGISGGIQTMILGKLGAIAITANSIALTLFQFVTVGNGGACNAAAVLIGKTVGEGRMDKVREYGNTLQVLFLLNGICFGTVLFLLKDFVLGFYVLDEAAHTLARSFIIVLSITTVGTSYQYPALGGIVRGAGDTRFVLYNDTIFVCAVVLPLSFLAAFVFGWPPVAVYACLKCDQILKCFVALVKVNRYRFVKVLVR